MEEFIQIFIFIGAMVISIIVQNAKNKKKPMTTSPEEVLEDMFPEIPFEGENETLESPLPPPAPIRRKKPRKPAPNPQIQSVQTPPQLLKPTKKIGIHNRKEARRAFIYSEIFNRKYS